MCVQTIKIFAALLPGSMCFLHQATGPTNHRRRYKGRRHNTVQLERVELVDLTSFVAKLSADRHKQL